MPWGIPPVGDPSSVEDAPNRARRAVGYLRVSGLGQVNGELLVVERLRTRADAVDDPVHGDIGG